MGQRSVPLDQITEYVKGLANENLLKATDKTAMAADMITKVIKT